MSISSAKPWYAPGNAWRNTSSKGQCGSATSKQSSWWSATTCSCSRGSVYAYIPESARRVRILKRLAEHLAPEGRILISYVPTDKARRAIRVTRLVARLTRSDWRPELGDSVAATGDSMSSVSFQHFFRTGDAEAEAAAAGLRVLAQVPSDRVITMALAKPSLG